MSSAPTTDTVAAELGIGDRHQAHRLRLKPRGETTGSVDGAWWPRSRDLAAELPDLLEVLGVRLGTVERVSYNLAEWGPTARKITAGDHQVSVAGYRSQHPGTIDVISALQRETLLVVPPETAEDAAHEVLMRAAHRGNADSVADLLA